MLHITISVKHSYVNIVPFPVLTKEATRKISDVLGCNQLPQFSPSLNGYHSGPCDEFQRKLNE